MPPTLRCLRLPALSSLVLLLTLSFSGCGGGGSSTTTPPPQSQNQNPLPVVASITPNSANAGDTGATIVISGSGFLTSSSVQWNQSNRPATYVSGTQLTVSLTTADLATAGVSQVAVINPGRGNLEQHNIHG